MFAPLLFQDVLFLRIWNCKGLIPAIDSYRKWSEIGNCQIMKYTPNFYRFYHLRSIPRKSHFNIGFHLNRIFTHVFFYTCRAWNFYFYYLVCHLFHFDLPFFLQNLLAFLKILLLELVSIPNKDHHVFSSSNTYIHCILRSQRSYSSKAPAFLHRYAYSVNVISSHIRSSESRLKNRCISVGISLEKAVFS